MVRHPRTQQLEEKIAKRLDVRVDGKDIAQIIIGAMALAIPVAASEDTWDLSTELPLLNTLGILFLTLAILGFFVYFVYFAKFPDVSRKHFFSRGLIAYLLTALISAIILLLFQKLPFDDIQVAFTRIVLVTFPSSFVATVVDSFD